MPILNVRSLNISGLFIIPGFTKYFDSDLKSGSLKCPLKALPVNTDFENSALMLKLKRSCSKEIENHSSPRFTDTLVPLEQQCLDLRLLTVRKHSQAPMR